ncbi:hypothetical protein F2P46_06520 [Massilia sp. CCM 8734]|nr:hypothetical protein [Massilia sp. CCM 8734]
MMATVEGPGIDPKWEKSWKMHWRFIEEMRRNDASAYRSELMHFASRGTTIVQPLFPPEPTDPPRQAWESSFLSSTLSTCAMVTLGWFEISSIKQKRWASSTGVHAFAASYTKQMIDMANHAKFERRHSGRTLQSLSPESVLLTALGLVLGCKEQAFTLARMQLSAHRRGYVGNADRFPVCHFMFRLLADFLGEAVPQGSGDAVSEPILSALFDTWRTPDPALLAPLCLGACDIHTFRSQPQSPRQIFFDFGDLKRTPIEILLLFKLRLSLGLDNPVLEHPIMATALGKLPEEVPFEPDSLVTAVRARMVAEGYDEQAIAAMYAS